MRSTGYEAGLELPSAAPAATADTRCIGMTLPAHLVAERGEPAAFGAEDRTSRPPTMPAMVLLRRIGRGPVGEHHFLVPVDQHRQHVDVVGDGVQQVGLPLELGRLAAQLLGLVPGTHAAAVAPGSHRQRGDAEQQQRQGGEQKARAARWRYSAHPWHSRRCTSTQGSLADSRPRIRRLTCSTGTPR